MLIKDRFQYPAMLDVKGKKCVIVGGGTVAARKLATLAQAGAQVTVISPVFSAKLKEEAALHPATLIEGGYRSGCLKDAFLVVAATDNKETNRLVTKEAPFLVNNITEPELSNFTVPASLHKGSITIAVASGGVPAFTRKLKELLGNAVPEALVGFDDFLQQQREELKSTPTTAGERTAFWHSLLDDELIDLVLAGRINLAKEKVRDAVSSFRAQPQDRPR